jgi:cell division protease FtsH
MDAWGRAAVLMALVTLVIHAAAHAEPRWILSSLALLGWCVAVMRRPRAAGGRPAPGESAAQGHVAETTRVCFDDVGGIGETRAELREVVGFLRDPACARRDRGRVARGVLLVGAPGSGTTLLARAVAGEAGVPFFSVSGPSLTDPGTGPARLRELFSHAEARAPSVIFIDELDALGQTRGTAFIAGHDAARRR